MTHSVQNRPLNHSSKVGTSFGRVGDSNSRFFAAMAAPSAATAACFEFSSGVPLRSIISPLGSLNLVRHLHLFLLSRYAGIFIPPAMRPHLHPGAYHAPLP